MSGWTSVILTLTETSLTRNNVPELLTEYPYLDMNLTAVEDYLDTDSNVYFSASRAYLGNRVKSYGGYLIYSLTYIPIIDGPGGKLSYFL